MSEAEKFWKTDDEFLAYVHHHSRTDRALFHRAHVVHLHVLAGERCPPCLPEFVAMYADYADPLITKARERLRLLVN